MKFNFEKIDYKNSNAHERLSKKYATFFDKSSWAIKFL